MKAYSLGLYEKAMPPTLSWREKLEIAKSSGYDFIEISIDESDEKLSRLDMDASERLALVQLMFETGIPIRSLCLSGHRKYPIGSKDQETSSKGMEIMQKTIQFADDLGVRIVMLAGYDVYYEESDKETRKLFLANLKKSVELAARSGILLAFETMETEFMNTVEKAKEIVSFINSPYLQIYPDIGNITNAAIAGGKDVLLDLNSGLGSLVAMHLKESKTGQFRDMMYGEGHVNFSEAIKTAWELGIRRFVTEFWYQDTEEWRDEILFARIFISRLLNKEQKIHA
nr:L-ribulose-5-phosphate 3-epimerase [uncultured Sphaerochaeta sp.]